MLAQPHGRRRRSARHHRLHELRQSRAARDHGRVRRRRRAWPRPAPALAFPVVSGNVSLYNETNGVAILPTPAIGGIGLIPTTRQDGDDHRLEAPGRRADPDRRDRGGHLGQSLYLRELHGRTGAPPPVDLDAERRNGDFVRGLIRAGAVSAVHDVSDGGLLVALAEMALAGGPRRRLDRVPEVASPAMPPGSARTRPLCRAADPTRPTPSTRRRPRPRCRSGCSARWAATR